ncbi:hypothetical protein CSKR_203235 [Clonorchis sinensis]|uniref:Uncharacterized protein n=1 Tax=Clonorchis sinensis TaxID=79923 RepID=A0A8T1M926_CLOSI|nr:hypothetical protein CSKR_203235 [Clonorchis sinensis]
MHDLSAPSKEAESIGSWTNKPSCSRYGDSSCWWLSTLGQIGEIDHFLVANEVELFRRGPANSVGREALNDGCPLFSLPSTPSTKLLPPQLTSTIGVTSIFYVQKSSQSNSFIELPLIAALGHTLYIAPLPRVCRSALCVCACVCDTGGHLACGNDRSSRGQPTDQNLIQVNCVDCGVATSVNLVWGLLDGLAILSAPTEVNACQLYADYLSHNDAAECRSSHLGFVIWEGVGYAYASGLLCERYNRLR